MRHLPKFSAKYVADDGGSVGGADEDYVARRGEAVTVAAGAAGGGVMSSLGLQDPSGWLAI